MKKLLITLILISLSIIVNSQFDDSKIAFVSYWSLGDSYDYLITKSVKKWEEGKQTVNQENSYMANFKVIDSTENTYTIKWTFENDLQREYKIPQEYIDSFSKYKVTEVLYKTTETGAFIEILNWKEIARIMNNMFDDMINIMSNNEEKKKSEMQKMMEPMKSIFSSKEGVEQITMKDIQLFHYAIGAEFSKTDTSFFDAEIPNLFGGEPMIGKTIIFIDSFNSKESYCELKQQMSIDEEDSKKLVLQAIKKMNVNEKEMKKVLKNSNIEIEDFGIHNFYYYPCIPEKIISSREVKFKFGPNTMRKIDQTSIVRINK